MPLVHINVSPELKTRIEEEAELRGLGLSAFIREAISLAVSKDYVTMHVDAYVAMIDGLRRGGQMVYAESQVREEAGG